MIYFKSCPKCRGDLTLGQDTYGTFISCLQCGFMRDVGATPGTAPASGASRPVPAWYAEEEEVLAKAA